MHKEDNTGTSPQHIRIKLSQDLATTYKLKTVYEEPIDFFFQQFSSTVSAKEIIKQVKETYSWEGVKEFSIRNYVVRIGESFIIISPK